MHGATAKKKIMKSPERSQSGKNW